MGIILLLTIGLSISGPVVSAADGAKARDHAEFFEARIRPVLVEHCISCHGPKKQESGLRLDSRAGLLKGNDAGPVVVPGQPDESPLIEAISHNGPVKMPPKAKLPAQTIADLRVWVEMGIPWPETTPRPIANGAGRTSVVSADSRNSWSLRPVQDRMPPVVKDAAWPRTSVDRFIAETAPSRTVNPVIAQALIDQAPRSLAETAQIYARVLGDAEPLWQDAVGRAKLDARTPEPLPVPALESLCQVLHGPDARSLAHAFLAGHASGSISWQSFVQALLMTNEFVFID